MNCEQFESLLDRYLDGELNGTLKLEFEAHMVDCESCGHLYAMSEAIGQIIACPSSDEPVLSDNFSDRILAELDRRNHRTIMLRKILAPAGLVASVAIMLMGLILLSSPSRYANDAVTKSAKVSKIKSPFMLPSDEYARKDDASKDEIGLTDTIQIKGNTNTLAPEIIGRSIVGELASDETDENDYNYNNRLVEGNVIKNSGVIPDDKASENEKLEKELNSWLSQTLERAGQSVWELAELKTLAWDKMREELISSLRPTNLLPAGSVMPINPPIIDNSGDIDAPGNEKINLEQGLELI